MFMILFLLLGLHHLSLWSIFFYVVFCSSTCFCLSCFPCLVFFFLSFILPLLLCSSYFFYLLFFISLLFSYYYSYSSAFSLTKYLEKQTSHQPNSGTNSACHTGPYPQYGWDFPEEIPERFRNQTPETLSERFLKFPSRVRLGCPKPYNSRHLRLPERFQNSLPPSPAGDASFFRDWFRRKPLSAGHGIPSSTGGISDTPPPKGERTQNDYASLYFLTSARDWSLR